MNSRLFLLLILIAFMNVHVGATSLFDFFTTENVTEEHVPIPPTQPLSQYSTDWNAHEQQFDGYRHSQPVWSDSEQPELARTITIDRIEREIQYQQEALIHREFAQLHQQLDSLSPSAAQGQISNEHIAAIQASVLKQLADQQIIHTQVIETIIAEQLRDHPQQYSQASGHLQQIIQPHVAGLTGQVRKELETVKSEMKQKIHTASDTLQLNNVHELEAIIRDWVREETRHLGTELKLSAEEIPARLSEAAKQLPLGQQDHQKVQELLERTLKDKIVIGRKN